MALILPGRSIIGPAVYGGTSPFSPSDLSPNAWYDPSDINTLWKDTSGTSAVTTDGDLVARIDDKSGNGYHLTQATSGNRPQYKTSGGLHWLLFDGVDDVLANTSFSLSGTTVHGYVAFQQNGGASYGRLISLNSGGNDYDDASRAALIIRSLTTDDFLSYRVNPVSSGTTFTAGTDYVVDAKFDGTDYTVRKNYSTTATAASSGTFSTTQINIGCDTASGALSCRVYGLVMFVSPTNSASLATWLGNKAGISI
jgi:hypothetical protein